MDILKKNKRLIFLILTIIMFVGISLGAGYFIYNLEDSRANLLETGLVTINFTEGENVNLTNTTPVIDEVGLTNEGFTFNVQNTSAVPVNMKIKFIENDGNTLPIEAVKYAFYVDSELIATDYLSKLDSEGNFYIYENFAATDTINCKLVLWVDYYYDTPNQTFGGKIKIEAESFDAIK